MLLLCVITCNVCNYISQTSPENTASGIMIPDDIFSIPVAYSFCTGP